MPSTSTAARGPIIWGGGNDTIIQVGGPGANEMQAYGGEGNAYIEQYGGAGKNNLVADGGFGDNVIKMYGGPWLNDMVYDCSYGADVATIVGGRGFNTLVINNLGQDFVLKDYQGNIVFQPGYDPPSGAPVAALSASAGVVTAGQHSVRVGFIPRIIGFGIYGSPGPASNTVQADGTHAIDVSQIPLGPAECQGRQIYLNQAGGDIWYLAATIMDNLSTTCTSILPTPRWVARPLPPGSPPSPWPI
jgi:hypothetical protein